MKNAHKTQHVITFGWPTFMIAAGTWILDMRTFAFWFSLLAFILSVIAFLVALDMAETKSIKPAVLRSCIGVAIGSSWGIGTILFYDALVARGFL